MTEREAIVAWPHYWSECEMCGPMVICGKCGNNCCNGGFGEDGKCVACPSAYEMQEQGIAGQHLENKDG